MSKKWSAEFEPPRLHTTACPAFLGPVYKLDTFKETYYLAHLRRSLHRILNHNERTSSENQNVLRSACFPDLRGGGSRCYKPTWLWTSSDLVMDRPQRWVVSEPVRLQWLGSQSLCSLVKKVECRVRNTQTTHNCLSSFPRTSLQT